MPTKTKTSAGEQYGLPANVQGTTDNSDSTDAGSIAEFWPSPIAWARDHEADAPADSIDLWPTPLGWSAAVEVAK